MLFLATSQSYAEANEAADGEHSAARIRHAEKTVFLHTLVYLTLRTNKKNKNIELTIILSSDSDMCVK